MKPQHRNGMVGLAIRHNTDDYFQYITTMKSSHILWTLLSVVPLPLVAQGDFVHITAADYVVNDSLPLFTQEVSLATDVAKAEVELVYPEYAPLSSEERRWLPRIEKAIGRVGVPTLDVTEVVEQKKKRLSVTFVPFIYKNGRWWRITSCQLRVVQKEREEDQHDFEKTQQRDAKQLVAKAMVTDVSSPRWAEHSVLREGRWVKIRVSQEGIYNLSADFLRRAGFNQPSRVKIFGYGGLLQDERLLFDTESESVDSHRTPDDLVEVPTLREGGQILFWAEGTQRRSYDKVTRQWSHENNYYSRYSYYFLTEGDAPLSITSLPKEDNSTGTPIEHVPFVAVWDNDETGMYEGGRRMFDGHDFSVQNSKTFNVRVEDLADVAEEHPVEVSFAASSTVNTTVAEVQLNQTLIGRLSASSYNSLTSSATLDTKTFSARLQDGNNSVTVTTTPGQQARMDFVNISYPRVLKVSAQPYSFSPQTQGLTTLSVQNANSTTHLWRIGQMGSPTAEVERDNLSEQRATYVVSTPQRRFVAFNSEDKFPNPELVGDVAPQDLHADRNIDYVIIVPTSGKLVAQAERLAELHRQRESLIVKVVRAEQLYNEFSSGTPDANAYRRYLKMLYDRADGENRPPRYLLLMGKSPWDNRFLTEDWKRENPDDYLLAYESDASSYNLGTVNSFITDDFYALLDDGEGENIQREKPDLATGRMVCVTEAQAKILVDKVERYLSNEDAGSWKNNVVMLGDDGDANEHMEDAERVSTEYAQGSDNRLNLTKIYWDRYVREPGAMGYTYPMVRQQILHNMEDGAAIFNYSGHGAPYQVSHEAALRLDDFKKAYNHRPTLWVLASCEIYPFDAKEDNLAEEFLYQPTGGSIAFMCATRAVYATQNNALNRRFAAYVVGRDVDGNRISMGEALRKAKNDLLISTGKSYRDVDNSINKMKYVYFGDPALVLSIPTGSVVLDSINGQALKADTRLQIEAGSVVTFSGHVTASADNSGAMEEQFSGTLSATIYDRSETITCRDNDGSAARRNREPLQFSERANVVFKGTGRVERGRFTFSAVVPRSISYSTDAARLSLYAVSDDKKLECSGANEQFYLNGTANSASPDTIAPKVLAYLNEVGKADYAIVGSNATLIADITDDAGINASQNALGHDMELSIDNEAPVSVNEYFSFALGSYSRGQIVYPLANLTPGTHTLRLRVWDVNDNPSTTTLRFVVAQNGVGETSLTATENPARTSTTFVANFPVSEAAANVTLDVSDASGQKVWTQRQVLPANTGSWSKVWNLRSNAGASLAAGLYVCRIKVDYADGRNAKASYKLVVVE